MTLPLAEMRWKRAAGTSWREGTIRSPLNAGVLPLCLPTISQQRDLDKYLKPLETESPILSQLLHIKDPYLGGGSTWKEMETGLMGALIRVQIAGKSPAFFILTASNEGPGAWRDEYLKHQGTWVKQTASLKAGGLGSGPVQPLIMATILESTSPGPSPECPSWPGSSAHSKMVFCDPRPALSRGRHLSSRSSCPAHSSVTATTTFNDGHSRSVSQRRETQEIRWFGAPFLNTTSHTT